MTAIVELQPNQTIVHDVTELPVAERFAIDELVMCRKEGNVLLSGKYLCAVKEKYLRRSGRWALERVASYRHIVEIEGRQQDFPLGAVTTLQRSMKLAGALLVFSHQDSDRVTAHHVADQQQEDFILSTFAGKFGSRLTARIDLEKNPVTFREGDGIPQPEASHDR